MKLTRSGKVEKHNSYIWFMEKGTKLRTVVQSHGPGERVEGDVEKSIIERSSWWKLNKNNKNNISRWKPIISSLHEY